MFLTSTENQTLLLCTCADQVKMTEEFFLPWILHICFLFICANVFGLFFCIWQSKELTNYPYMFLFPWHVFQCWHLFTTSACFFKKRSSALIIPIYLYLSPIWSLTCQFSITSLFNLLSVGTILGAINGCNFRTFFRKHHYATQGPFVDTRLWFLGLRTQYKNRFLRALLEPIIW